MTIPITCEHCKRKVTAPAHLAGKSVRCPKCRKGIAVPMTDNETNAETYGFQADAKEGKSKKSKTTAPAEGRSRAASDAADDSEPLRLAEDEKEEEKAQPIVEVQFENGEIRSFGAVKEIKKLLLDGTLTRHNKSRSIAPKPTLADVKSIVMLAPSEREELLQKMIKKWQQRKKWTPIGDSLAKDDEGLRSMYENPYRKWYIRGQEAVFIGSWLILGPILLVVFWNWEPGSMTSDEPANPRIRGAGDALAGLLTPKLIWLSVTLFVLFWATFFLTIIFGEAIAPWLARMCGAEGEPPDDGFEPAANEADEDGEP